jgi:hypothetical protein
MATVRQVVNFRVKPGRDADLLEAIRAVKKIIEPLGANVVVNRQVVGPEAGNIIAVVVYKDYAGYAKVASDPELSKLGDTMRNNSNLPWDAFTSALNEEVAL